jgi:hypothetical protein
MKSSLRGLVGIGVLICMLAWTASAFANAPNPIPGTTKVDAVSLSNGQYTVTVEGQWNWVTQTNCPTARDGVGYQVAWFDGDTSNPIGGNNSPDGVIFVGDSQDNIVHSVDVLGGSTQNGQAFWDGVPTSYIQHAPPNGSSTPNKTDASNWVSNCSNENPTTQISSGTWGPISHTYPAGFTGPFKFCPVMYDPHGSGTAAGGKIGSSSVGDLTAGGQGHNGDNSYEGNGQGTNGNNCQIFTIPTLTTSAHSASSFGSPVSDTATLSGSSPTGTITWNVYASGDANCTTPLNSQPSTLTATVTGNGNYSSPDYTPTAAGDYKWVATYSGDGSNGSISTACNDPKEVSTVPPPPSKSNAPGMRVIKFQKDALNPDYTRDILVVENIGTQIDYKIEVFNTGNTDLTLTFSDPRCTQSTIVGPTLVTGTLSGTTLSPGGEVFYTCSRDYPGPDVASSFTNTAHVVGQPPTGPAIHESSSVTATHPVHPVRVCKSTRTGRQVKWPRGTPKPKACQKHPSRKPKRPSGFTG